MPFFFILSLRQAGHLISRVIRISLFYQNPTCFFSAYFLKHHQDLKSSLEAVNEETDTVEACKILNKTFGRQFPIPEIQEVSEPVVQTYYTQEGKSA